MFIKIENLGKKYGDEYVFSNMTSMITDSHKVGIIGKNGSGKTTFLKILAGELRAERGSIEIDPKGAKVVYHTQVINETIELIDDIADITCFTYLMSQNKELLKYWLKLNSENPELDYSELITEYSELNGYDFEDKIIKACKKLKLNPEDKVVNLSGGQKTRLQLAKLLIEDHDILLLDEPTNHLDIDGLEWFYEYIKKYKGIVIIASHDRNLLSKSVNKIVEFEKGKVTEYTGNYEAYRAKKQELRIAKENRIRANEKKVSQLNETAKKLEERVGRHVKKAEELEVANFRAARLLKRINELKQRL